MKIIEVIALKTFQRAVKKHMDDKEQRALATILRDTPEAGDVIQGTGGVRKVRWAYNAGKRGGWRVIYYFMDKEGRVFLITAYRKTDKETLSKAEKNALKQLTDSIQGG